MLLPVPKMIRVFLLVCLSIGGGLTAALTYAATIEPDVGLRMVTLPAVADIAIFFGSIAGLLISPLMVWALYDKKVWVAVPVLYGVACLVIIVLNMLSIRFSELIALGVTVVALFLYRLLGKRHAHSGFSDEIG